MHEARRKRLAQLEAATAQRQQTDGRVVRIFFAGIEEQALIAEGSGNFACHRRADETLDDFEARACNEVLALMPPRGTYPPPILIFK